MVLTGSLRQGKRTEIKHTVRYKTRVRYEPVVKIRITYCHHWPVITLDVASKTKYKFMPMIATERRIDASFISLKI